jgi:hypothetical protein
MRLSFRFGAICGAPLGQIFLPIGLLLRQFALHRQVKARVKARVKRDFFLPFTFGFTSQHGKRRNSWR